MQKKLFFSSLIIFLFAGLFLSTSNSLADRVEKMKEVPVKNDFPVGPSQIEIEANPGEVIKKEIQIDNRAGEKRDFHIEVEDFEGSNTNPDQTVLLQGEKGGRYGAKDWFSLEKKDFSIEHGDRQYLDVTIEIPENADAGDHYTSVLVSMIPREVEKKEGSNVRITSRAGILFFIKIKGVATKAGEFKSFKVEKEWYWNLLGEKDKDGKIVNAVNLETTFGNSGTVRLRPSGKIEIKNMLGKTSDVIDVEAYNVLRDSVRQMNYAWDKTGFRLGKYTATLKLDRGYDNLADTKEVSFWIIPLKQILIGVLAFFLLIIIIYLLRKNIHIQIRKKQ
ncbi:MAG: hypothetical protein WAV31_06060 [Candidatus Moraniibacteriota bacterium]